MESVAAPNSGACSWSCGVVEDASSAKGAECLGIISDATRSALLTVSSAATFVLWENENTRLNYDRLGLRGCISLAVYWGPGLGRKHMGYAVVS